MIVLIIPSWYVSSYNELSGVFFKEQAEALAKNESVNKVIVLAINHIRIKDLIKKRHFDFGYDYKIINNVHTHTLNLPFIPKITNLLRFFLGKKILKKIVLNEKRIDIAHLHSYFFGDFVMWLKNEFKIPYVVTEHTTDFSRDIMSTDQLHYAKKIFQKSNLNIAVSNEFKGLLENKLKETFLYIPNIVSSDFLYNEKRKLNVFQFINIGFLEKKKNQNMLIRAFNNAFLDTKDVSLLIVGDGNEYKNLKKLISDLRLKNRVKLFGRASRTEIRELLIKSNAFVLASKNETFGVVVVEAMLSGLPVVSTKCGGPESIINDVSLGVLTDVNEDSLSDGMKELYNNYTRYRSEKISSYANDNFSEKVVINKLVKIYKEHKVLK